MAKGFPFLELPDVCAYNVLSRLDNMDLFRVGKLPLGNMRQTFTYVMETRENPSAMDIQIRRCAMKGYSIWEKEVKLDLRVEASISIYKWKEKPVIHNVELRFSRVPHMMVGMLGVVGGSLFYKENDKTCHIWFQHPNNHPSLIRKYVRGDIPEWMGSIMESVILRLRGAGYNRYKEKRDYNIGYIELLLGCIKSPTNPDWPEWLEFGEQ